MVLKLPIYSACFSVIFFNLPNYMKLLDYCTGFLYTFVSPIRCVTTKSNVKYSVIYCLRLT